MTNDKTPEQLAEEWAKVHSEKWDAIVQRNYFGERSLTPEGHYRIGAEQGFRAGYEAAMKQKSWVLCAEQMPKIGDEILMGHYRNAGKWWWCAGCVDGDDDGLFIDLELDGEEIRTDCFWIQIPPPKKEPK